MNLYIISGRTLSYITLWVSGIHFEAEVHEIVTSFRPS